MRLGLGIGLNISSRRATPLSLLGSKVVAWYDPSDRTTLFKDTARTLPTTANADIIHGVADKSGLAHHLSSDGVNGPTRDDTGTFWDTATVNTLLGFDGVNDTLSTAFALNHPVEVLMVIGTNGTLVNGDHILDGPAAANSLGVARDAGAASLVAAVNATILTLTNTRSDNLLVQFRVCFNGATSSARYNNQTEQTGALPAPAVQPGGLILGHYGGGGFYAKVSFGEIVVTNAALSAQERLNMEGYFRGKWHVA